MHESVPESDTAIVMLVGPIKHWWDENWETPDHWTYEAWRERVSEGLVEADYLVYRPHHAFKGKWDERAQSVNDTALRAADVLCNLTPPGVSSLGTDGEILYAANEGNALVVAAPPPENFDKGMEQLLTRLANLDIHREIVNQEVVLESIPMRPGREWMLRASVEHFTGHVLRVHYFDQDHGVQTTDGRQIIVPQTYKWAHLQPLEGSEIDISLTEVLKLEILERKIH